MQAAITKKRYLTPAGALRNARHHRRRNCARGQNGIAADRRLCLRRGPDATADRKGFCPLAGVMLFQGDSTSRHYALSDLAR